MKSTCCYPFISMVGTNYPPLLILSMHIPWHQLVSQPHNAPLEINFEEKIVQFEILHMCEEECYPSFEIQLLGKPPFTIVVENTSKRERTEIVVKDYHYKFNASKPGVYKLVSMQDSNCKGICACLEVESILLTMARVYNWISYSN
jgi:hypothetical protein